MIVFDLHRDDLKVIHARFSSKVSTYR